LKRYPALDRAIRQEIAAVRTAGGLTQRELCAKLKRRNNYIQNIESGRQSVGAAELHIIARACGSTGAELLGRAIQATDK
jgi:transcriptional regulator with XRE-family HTH domain